MTNRLVLLGALLLPAVAAAQPADPDAPPPPAPVTNQPTVIVNPPAPPPAPTEVTIEATTAPVPPPVITTTQPEYDVVEDSYNAPMFTTGALVFGLTYGASVITAAASDNERGNQRLYVPLVGPWLALNDRSDCDITRSSCDHETTAKVLLIADGVFQAAGVLAMLDGIFQPTTRRVVRHSAMLDTKVHVTPTAVHGDPGLQVFGRF